MNTKKRNFFIGITVLVFLAISISAYSQESQKLIVFHSPSCHRCLEVKDKLMPQIENEFKDKIQIEYRDITDIENYKFLLSLKERYRRDLEIILPVFYFKGDFLNGKGEIENNLKTLIVKSLSRSHKEGYLPTVDLIAKFKNFKPLVIISAGLIDGINPCAFTVIVFFISFLVLQGYRKRELAIIGLTFIFAVFLTYILIGLGLFSFLYRLESFRFISRLINFSIGILSIILGIFALYDFFRFKKTKETEGLLLQLPPPIKNQIHSLIGLHYRDQQLKEAKIPKRNILRLAISALITGFLVSLLEAICTGQTYLPTIVFILKTARQLKALLYLLLYNFMFIAPLLLIFIFALLGVSSEQFSKFLKKHLSLIKILMAVLFFGLGIFLIWSP